MKRALLTNLRRTGYVALIASLFGCSASQPPAPVVETPQCVYLDVAGLAKAAGKPFIEVTLPTKEQPDLMAKFNMSMFFAAIAQVQASMPAPEEKKPEEKKVKK